MLTLILAAVLAAASAQPCRADGHNRSRSRTARAAFRRAHPCPGGPDRGSTMRCQGYVIDHVCPLECCGPDAPSNMQWQTAEASKAKDRWEGDCARSCHRPILGIEGLQFFSAPTYR